MAWLISKIDDFMARLARALGWEVSQEQIPNPVPMTTPQPINPDDTMYPWDTQAHNYHNVRVLCDKAGLTHAQKNIITACLYQESTLLNVLPNGNPVRNNNRDPETGQIWSSDFGIAQINDHFNIGVGKPFPSVDYVIQHPEATVGFMIQMLKAGKLSLWASYSTGAYKKWLSSTGPLSTLAQENGTTFP